MKGKGPVRGFVHTDNDEAVQTAKAGQAVHIGRRHVEWLQSLTLDP